MSHKTAAPCLDASLEMFWPLCCFCTHRLQWDLCRCLHKRSLQAPQAAVTLIACHALQNSSQFIVQGVKVWTPRGPILGAEEGQNIPPQPILSRLGLVGRRSVLLEDPFLTSEEGCAKMFHNSLKHIVLVHSSSSFTPFLQKWRVVTPWWDPPSPNHNTERVRASPHHKSCCSGGCTAPRWWRFSHPWRGCFCTTGGDTLLLSVRSPSKQE